jgi:ABC-type transporter MlaC component
MKSMIACGYIAAVILMTAACSPRRIPPVTVSDLMEDRVALDGVLMKCNREPAKARQDSDCMNARIAVERLAARIDPEAEAKKLEDFEKSREQLRAAQDKKRQDEESKIKKVDAYHLPVIPVEPTPAPKDPQSPTVSQTNP